MASRRAWIAAVSLFVLGDAVALQTRGALLPSFQSAFDVSPGLLGLVAPAGTVGFVAAVLAVGFAAGRLDVRHALLAGVALTGGSLLLASAAPTYGLLLLFLAAQGTATGVVRALDRPILGRLSRRVGDGCSPSTRWRGPSAPSRGRCWSPPSSPGATGG